MPVHPLDPDYYIGPDGRGIDHGSPRLRADLRFPVTHCTFCDADHLGAAAPAPTTAFSADVVSGDAPLLVAFTDESTQDPTSWEWDFGDGSAVSTEQHPTHEYEAAGTYTVTLTATNAAGSDDEVKVAYIDVTAPSVAPAPVIEAVGAYAAAGSTQTAQIPYPAGVVADDIIIAFFETRWEGHLVTPEGWAHAPSSPKWNGSSTSSLEVTAAAFWKRAVGGETGTVVFSTVANHKSGRMIRVSGCVTAGDPFEACANSASTAEETTASVTGGTTTGPNRLVLALLTPADSLPAFTSRAAPNLADYANVATGSTEVSDDGSLTIEEGVLPEAGPIGNASWAWNDGVDRYSAWIGALIPEPV